MVFVVHVELGSTVDMRRDQIVLLGRKPLAVTGMIGLTTSIGVEIDSRPSASSRSMTEWKNIGE